MQTSIRASLHVLGSIWLASVSCVAGAVISGTNTNSISIRASGPAVPYPSTISISGATGVVKKMTVTWYDLLHTHVGDVRAVLVNPDGSKDVVLLESAAPCGWGDDVLTFDDAATNFVGCFASGGVYRPQSALFEFAGTNPNGTWSLFISDEEHPDGGRIRGGWSLAIELDVNVLGIRHFPDFVEIAWPVEAQDYVLESRTNLAS